MQCRGHGNIVALSDKGLKGPLFGLCGSAPHSSAIPCSNSVMSIHALKRSSMAAPLSELSAAP